jgi:uncharacterized protein YcaQ
MKLVVERITNEGPLMARDFDHKGKKVGDWQSKPAKRALEYLFMQGDLMVPARVNFHKVYDLTERVLPEGTDTTLPSPEEHARFLIRQFLRANGLGRPAEIAYLRKRVAPLIKETLQAMRSNGEILLLHVAGEAYYAFPDSLKLLTKPLARSKLKILSPFDNLVIQRKRMKALFGFDYLIECYVPEAKRKYGYFSLPILWDGRLVARMNCKAERTKSLLHIHHLALEPSLLKTDAFLAALRKELNSFMTFNQCTDLKVHRTTPTKFKAPLKAAVKGLGR